MKLPTIVSGPWKALVATLQVLAPLLVRVVIGYSFVQAGLGKLQNLERTAGFFENLGIPAPTANAAFVAILELVGGACLVLGLGTRVLSSLLAATMVVAVMTADRQNLLDALAGRGQAGLTDIVPLVYLMCLLLLVAFGPGVASIDQFLGRRSKSSS
jgi:putative oxidoreductase